MNRSLYSVLVATAAAALLSLARAVDSFLRSAWTVAVRCAFRVVAGPSLVPARKAPAALQLATARQFTRKLMRRDRPVISSTWRMCPSV